MTIVYGIPNCETVKKARLFLEGRGVDYVFHDFKKQGLDEAKLKAWVKTAGWEKLLNTRGTTWRKIPDADKAGLTEAKAIRLMLANLSVIKRPVIESPAGLTVGFGPAEQSALATLE